MNRYSVSLNMDRPQTIYAEEYDLIFRETATIVRFRRGDLPPRVFILGANNSMEIREWTESEIEDEKKTRAAMRQMDSIIIPAPETHETISEKIKAFFGKYKPQEDKPDNL